MQPVLAVRWVRQALVGLDYCHRKRILHRDLTTGNIFLNSEDHALIGDFGAAANLDEDGTAPAGGNQHCRAPEGFGGQLSIASDLFSAGASLCRLLTGSWPYEAETEVELAHKMREGDRPRLRDVAPHVHRSIAAVVESALSAEPAERPAAALDMSMSLAKCRSHERNWIRVAADGGEDFVFVTASGGAPLRLTAQYHVNSASPRLLITAGLLASYGRPSLLLSDARAKTFKTWLGLRYDRAAIPEHLVALAKEVATRCGSRSGRAAAEEVHEVLMQFDDSASPPRVALFAVVADSADKQIVRTWLSDASLRIDTKLGVVAHVDVATKAETSLVLIENSYAADLSQLTWRGEEPTGAA